MNRRLLALLLAVMMCTLCACGRQTPSGVVSGEDDGDLDDVIVEIDAASSEKETVAKEEDTSLEETEATEMQKDPDESSSDAQNDQVKPSEDPTEAPEETTVPAPPAEGTTEYEWYNSLSGDEQMAFMQSFESVPAFFDWYNAAKAEYDALHPEIEIDDNVIDLGDLAGGNG